MRNATEAMDAAHGQLVSQVEHLKKQSVKLDRHMKKLVNVVKDLQGPQPPKLVPAPPDPEGDDTICKFTSCGECVQDARCGWCIVSGTCLHGDLYGPISSTCTLWTFERCVGACTHLHARGVRVARC